MGMGCTVLLCMARFNQRIGRDNRIGQRAQCINVINLIAKNSIEEGIIAVIRLKGDLFSGVFDDGQDDNDMPAVKLSHVKSGVRSCIITFIRRNMIMQDLTPSGCSENAGSAGNLMKKLGQ